MSMYDTTYYGRFTSDGSTKILILPAGVDYMEVLNYTQMATQQSTGRGVMFKWQRGMAVDTGVEIKKTNSTDALNGVTLTSGGFSLVDTSDQVPGAAKTGTTLTKAAPPVCTATAHGFSTGDTVRIYSGDLMTQINGLEFTVTVTGANTFTLTNMDTNTAAFTANTAFMCRKIPNGPLWVPQKRVITDISVATSAIVTFAVTHGYQVGQIVRMKVPSEFGMVEMDELVGEVTAIGAADANGYTNTVTLDIDSSAFTAFAWPTTAAYLGTPAMAVPVGENNSVITGSFQNQAYIGISLAAGAQAPAGSASDVIYWRAGTGQSIS